MRTLLVTLTMCLWALPANAKYSGGTGEPNDPYQIATAADLIALGETPADYDKHFILTADIDLDPNLPGRKVFDKAVIRCCWEDDTYTPFTGVLDGSGHTISHLTIQGEHSLGLFEYLEEGAEIKNLGVVDVNVTGSGSMVGGLVGWNFGGVITDCYSTGSVSGNWCVGGLVGENEGTVTGCYSTSAVSGNRWVGGLAGLNDCLWSEEGSMVVSLGTLTDCYSTGPAAGNSEVGGLAGANSGSVMRCYSAGTVSGDKDVGGLVGYGKPTIHFRQYSWYSNTVQEILIGVVTASFWDTQTSGCDTSAGGTGKTTAEMQTPVTFAFWGCGRVWTVDEGVDYPRLWWEDKPGEVIEPIWLSDFLSGCGTEDDPYLIYTNEDLNLVGLAVCDYDKHFKLMADIDLAPDLPGRKLFDRAVIAPETDDTGASWFEGIPFTGVFDGNGHAILHLTITGGSHLGLFGQLALGAHVKNLGLVDVNVAGYDHVGGLAGTNGSWDDIDSSVTYCSSSGGISGDTYVGGIVGETRGTLTHCYSSGFVAGINKVGGVAGEAYGDARLWDCHSTAGVSGGNSVGGLIGGASPLCWLAVPWCSSYICEYYCSLPNVSRCSAAGPVNGEYNIGGLVGFSQAHVIQSHSTGAVTGTTNIGGLVGSMWKPQPGLGYTWSAPSVTDCYSTGAVTGDSFVGGLIGRSGKGTRLTYSYSTGAVNGAGQDVGGLVGLNESYVWQGLWDIETSGQVTSSAGTGKTTIEMQTASTFLDAGWDFAGETGNGTEDIWWILEGKDYPRLWWEAPAIDDR